MADPSDDLTQRGRAIFQRLRSGTDGPEDGADEVAAPAAAQQDDATPHPAPRMDLPSPTVEQAPTAGEASADEPAAGHPEPASTPDGSADAAVAPTTTSPAPGPGGPLPGRADLPDVEELSPAMARATDDLPAAEELEPPGTAEAPAEASHHFARPLPRIMAVANQKGGVGKTTTAVNLGACLADLGYRVLVVDLDPQGNASTGLGINIRDLQGSMYDVILHGLPIEDCVEATSVRNLFCAPSSLDLAGAEIELVPAFSREQRLKRALEEVRDDYDFVLIDCPPSLGLLTVNGLAAATEVVVPIQCEYYALEGLGQLLRNVSLVQKNLNPVLEVSAIVLVMYDARTKLADQVVSEVRAHFGDKVCKNVVPRTVRLSEAPSFGQPIIAFDSSSRGAIAYRELAKEVSGGTPQRAG